MSAQKFIVELDRRKVVSDKLMAKLRDAVGGIRTPLSAEQLADFLVQKKLLTRGQADDVLAGLSLSGVNLGEEDDVAPLGQNAGESSSVFASHIFSHPISPPPPPPEEEEEIRLLPIEEDFETKRVRSDIIVDEGVPMLEEVPAMEPLPSEEVAIPAPSAKRSRRVKSEEPTDTSLVEEALSPGVQAALAAETPPQTLEQQAAIRRIRERKKNKPSKSKKSWDSPLILIGGGVLAFLVLAGGMIVFLMNWESGDQKLALAREAMKSGAYAQAVEQFQDFLDSSPRHAEHSAARVQLATLKIRQAAEANEYAQALELAQSELKAIEDEPAFETARPEIADLVPRIAEGLAKQAEQSPPLSDDTKKFVDLANKSIELWNNTTYLPKEMRDEARLTNIRDTLERVARRQQSQVALTDGLKTIDQALVANKPIEAYAAHFKLLTDHPELAGEKALAEAIQKTTAAEVATIKYVAEQKAAETSDHPTPWLAALAVANRKANATAPAAGTACLRVDGAVYGIDVASGKLLWRRYVGYSSSDWPLALGKDVVLRDGTRHELLRLDAASGNLIWRQAIDEPFTTPLLAGDRAYLPAKSGKLFVVDINSGARLGYLQTPQPLPIAPVLDRTKTHLYLPGEQGSVYTIALPDMKCVGAYFLGHAPGTIHTAPVIVMDKLVVVEDSGVETSRLHLLITDSAGTVSKQQAERRLNGMMTSPPQTTGRGLIVVTDRGQIEVYDIAAGNEGDALTPIATREANSVRPVTRHAAVIGRNIWVADMQLTKFNIVSTGNRLPVEEIEDNFNGAAFDHPLQTFGDVLVELHRPKGRAGAVVAALNTKQGHAYWQTELAMPPAGAPIVNEVTKSMTVANAAGYAFRFDEAAIRSRVQDVPLVAELVPPKPPLLSMSVALGQGRAAFCAANSEWLLLTQPDNSGAAKWLRLESPLTCEPTLFGRGLLAPSAIGQVFYLSTVDGSRLAGPFQPLVETDSTVAYKSAGAVGTEGKQFVITDGGKRIFLVGVKEMPQPHLEAVKEGDVGPRPITSPVVVVGDVAVAVAANSRLMKFKLPTLESAGESNLSASAEWGPFTAGDVALLATADQKLLAVPSGADVRWRLPMEHGRLAGPPLTVGNDVLLAYQKGILERRALADGKVLATKNVEQPLATGPVPFLQKLVLAGNDGTILVIDQP
jgi:tetratricopeptide (TPR) repeat protein